MLEDLRRRYEERGLRIYVKERKGTEIGTKKYPVGCSRLANLQLKAWARIKKKKLIRNEIARL